MLVKSDFDNFLKEYWTAGKLEILYFKHRPFLAMCPKNTEVGGEKWIVPIELDLGADGSPTFSDAQAIAEASGTDLQTRQFVVDYVEDFQISQISNKLLRLSRKQPQLALYKAAETTKQKKDILAQRLARSMYRTGYGELGTIDTSVSALSTSIIGLSVKTDARNFRIGQRLVFASSLTAALRDSGDYVSVTGIDFDNKKIATDAPTNLSTSITSLANADKIFLKGARGSGSSPTLLTMQGLGSWVPETAPAGSENFNGVDRSLWPDRLAGLRYNGGSAVSGPIQEILVDSLVEAAIREAYCDRVFMDPLRYGEALKSMMAQVDRIKETVGKVGFNGFEVQIGYGSSGVKVFPDANCPTSRHWALTLDTFELGSAGPLIQNDLQHGQGRDVHNGSTVEYRDVFTGAMICKAPGKNQVVVYA